MPIDKTKLNDLSHYGAALTSMVQTVDLLLGADDPVKAEETIRVTQDIAEQFKDLIDDIVATM